MSGGKLAELRPGDRVRVTMEGRVVPDQSDPTGRRALLQLPDGTIWRFPSAATIEVVKP